MRNWFFKSMKIVPALFLFLWLGSNVWAQGGSIGPPNYPICTSNTGNIVSGLSNSTVRLVGGLSSPTGPGGVLPSIYMCGGVVTSLSGSTFQLQSAAQGSNCTSGAVNLIPGMNVGTTPTQIYTTNPTIVAPQGKDLCIQIGTNPINAIFWFTQY